MPVRHVKAFLAPRESIKIFQQAYFILVELVDVKVVKSVEKYFLLETP